MLLMFEDKKLFEIVIFIFEVIKKSDFIYSNIRRAKSINFFTTLNFKMFTGTF